MKKKIIFTCGDINGICPEIIIRSLQFLKSNSSSCYTVICPPAVFENAVKKLKARIKFKFTDNPDNRESGITVYPLEEKRQQTGGATKSSGETAYEAIKLAVEFAKNRQADAIVTAPISKTALNMAGINFPGHTEMIAEWTNSKHFVMTFLSKRMKASLVTIHKPLKKVSVLITEKNLHSTFSVVINSLRYDLNIDKPKIAVLGLNPHAGENGIIGSEDQEIIGPSLNSYPERSFLSGPFSPDAFFANRLYKNFDMVIGMYHDQVLIPFKLLNFGGGVNYTAGLPIVRTSPDHGVAYDIAGKNLADPSSFIEAVKYAEKISNSRKRNEKKKSF